VILAAAMQMLDRGPKLWAPQPRRQNRGAPLPAAGGRVSPKQPFKFGQIELDVAVRRSPRTHRHRHRKWRFTAVPQWRIVISCSSSRLRHSRSKSQRCYRMTRTRNYRVR